MYKISNTDWPSNVAALRVYEKTILNIFLFWRNLIHKGTLNKENPPSDIFLHLSSKYIIQNIKYQTYFPITE